MLLYKVILASKDQKEFIYRSISSKAKLPDLDITRKNAGAMLVITTCDLAGLDADEREIYLKDLEASYLPKPA